MDTLNKKMNIIGSVRKTLSIDELHQLNILNLYNENKIQLIKKYSSSNDLNIEQILSIANISDTINVVLRRDVGVISLELFISKTIKQYFYNKPINYYLNFVNYPKEYLSIFKDKIDSNFEEYCEDIYRKELKKQKKNKIEKIKNRLLNEQ